ncbi:hypothetical protein [Tunturiibacter psychrotolerans]|uniref:hypothetical protein n=1 Tax=Tunturiibacter psychrotolerans TaxID=3069686 RepID=UPI003D228D28
MACTLAICSSAEADYQGATGANFEIAVSSSSGTATLNYARYNGAGLTSAPWTFAIAADVNVLTLVIESTAMGDRISINEITNGCKKVLDAFDYTPSLAPEGLEIKGL